MVVKHLDEQKRIQIENARKRLVQEWNLEARTFVNECDSDGFWSRLPAYEKKAKHYFEGLKMFNRILANEDSFEELEILAHALGRVEAEFKKQQTLLRKDLQKLELEKKVFQQYAGPVQPVGGSVDIKK